MKKIGPLIILLSLLAFSISPVSAQLINPTKKAEMEKNTNSLATETGYPIEKSFEDLAATVIRVITGILGVLFLSFAFVAGYNWMNAGGNEEKIKKSKDTLRDLIIGLILVLAVYALASYLGGLISNLLLAS